jgi:hypothetical protein
MHRLARRAGYPSDSSRADRHQPRARLAGGGPLLYHYAGDLLRHLRHRPGRPAAGRCHLCARPGAGPGEKPPSPHPAAGAGPGAVHHRHRPWAAGAGPGAVPRRGLLSLERGPASVTAPGRRSAPGPVLSRAAARWPLTVPHVADRLVFTRAFGRAGPPDCSAARGPDAVSTVATWREQFRAGGVSE